MVEIAPGVQMPALSLGTCCGSEPGVGLLPWIAAGGRGIDTGALSQHIAHPGSTQVCYIFFCSACLIVIFAVDFSSSYLIFVCHHTLFRLISMRTAWDYFDQKAVGKGIKASGIARSELFVLTKVPPILDAAKIVQKDLEQLDLDYVDLILLHNPTTKADNAAQWAKLEDALAQNLTRAIGISDFSKAQVEDLLETAKVVPAVLQAEMSVGHHDDDNIAFCAAHNITYEVSGGGSSVVVVAVSAIVQRKFILTLPTPSGHH